jgi:hypothetical protein
MKKIIFTTFFSISLFLFSVVSVKASEGVFYLRPTNKEAYRCWAASLYMPTSKYRLLVGCVDLIYPPQFPQLYKSYVLWSVPTAGGKAVRLGELAGGKAQFEVQKSFSSLFVTVEPNATPLAPSKNIVMQGSLEPIVFLQKPTSPTPSPKPEVTTVKSTNETTSPQEVSSMTTKDKLILALRRAGIAAGVALVAIIGLIFVVSKSRG